MIPQAHILEWNQQVPWQSIEQVEQDLVISRALVELFSDSFLASSLAFRGGTALTGRTSGNQAQSTLPAKQRSWPVWLVQSSNKDTRTKYGRYNQLLLWIHETFRRSASKPKTIPPEYWEQNAWSEAIELSEQLFRRMFGKTGWIIKRLSVPFT